MAKLIAIDLDGTLFYPKKRIKLVSKLNVAFLHRAIKFGHEVVFVTSRNQKFVKKVLKEINLDLDYVGRNGCVVIHKHQVIRDEVMKPKDIQEVTKYLLSRHQRLMMSIDTKTQSNLVFTSNYAWYLDWLYRFYYLFQGRYREAYLKDNELFTQTVKNSQTIQRLLVYFGLGKKAKVLSYEESLQLKKKFPELEIAWINGLIEVASLGTNKATALMQLATAKQFSPDDVIVIGDSGNDIPMFHAFKDSYCMVHAHPEVKKHARHTIHQVHELSAVLFPQ